MCWNSTVVEAFGNEKGLLAGVKLQDVKSGKTKDVQASRSSELSHGLGKTKAKRGGHGLVNCMQSDWT